MERTILNIVQAFLIVILTFALQCNSSLLNDSSYSRLLGWLEAAQYLDKFSSNGGDIGTHGSDWQHLYLVKAWPKPWGSINVVLGLLYLRTKILNSEEKV